MCTLDVINARLDYFDKLNQEAIANGENLLKKINLQVFFVLEKSKLSHSLVEFLQVLLLLSQVKYKWKQEATNGKNVEENVVYT